MAGPSAQGAALGAVVLGCALASVFAADDGIALVLSLAAWCGAWAWAAHAGHRRRRSAAARSSAVGLALSACLWLGLAAVEALGGDEDIGLVAGGAALMLLVAAPLPLVFADCWRGWRARLGLCLMAAAAVAYVEGLLVALFVGPGHVGWLLGATGLMAVGAALVGLAPWREGRVPGRPRMPALVPSAAVERGGWAVLAAASVIGAVLGGPSEGWLERTWLLQPAWIAWLAGVSVALARALPEASDEERRLRLGVAFALLAALAGALMQGAASLGLANVWEPAQMVLMVAGLCLALLLGSAARLARAGRRAQHGLLAAAVATFVLAHVLTEGDPLPWTIGWLPCALAVLAAWQGWAEAGPPDGLRAAATSAG